MTLFMYLKIFVAFLPLENPIEIDAGSCFVDKPK